MRWARDSLLLFGIWAGGLTLPCVGASGGGDPPELKPLAAKEQMIRDQVKRLEDRMFRLREQLAETEPENAAKLARALEKLGQAGIEEKLSILVELLGNEAALSESGERQKALVQDLEGVLSVLLERRSPEERERQMQALKEAQRRINELLEEQRGQRSQAAGQANSAQKAQQLGDAIRRIDDLMERQEALESESGTEAAQAQALAEAQQRLSEDAQQLADDVRRMESGQEGAESEAEGQEPSEGSAAQQASRDVRSAAKNMQQASEALQQEGNAAEKQAEAKEDLGRARHRLEEELNETQPPEGEDQAQAAQAQRSTAGKAGKLAQDMRSGQMGQEAGEPSEGQEGQPESEGSQPPPEANEPVPGEQNVDQARQHMERAAEDLDEKNPGGAVPKQDDAIEELEQALDDVEEQLQQLRKEQQEELLRDLESRFANMLAREKTIHIDTVAIDGRRGAELQRADVLRLAELQEEQNALAEAAATCLHILEEEGSTVVFPSIVEQLGADMGDVAERLGQSQTGRITQVIEEEIIQTLEDLIGAVQKKRQENQEQGESGGSSDEDPPLLPGSAELKLLRAAQVRVNSRTAAVAEVGESGESAAADVQGVLGKIEIRQRQVADMAREMRDRAE